MFLEIADPTWPSHHKSRPTPSGARSPLFLFLITAIGVGPTTDGRQRPRHRSPCGMPLPGLFPTSERASGREAGAAAAVVSSSTLPPSDVTHPPERRRRRQRRRRLQAGGGGGGGLAMPPTKVGWHRRSPSRPPRARSRPSSHCT